MRQQSPQSKFQPQLRVMGSPQTLSTMRDSRPESVNSRVTKVTTYRHPKTTITTTTYRPVMETRMVETRTVRLCSGEPKCSQHESQIDQLQAENIRLNQRVLELQTELEARSMGDQEIKYLNQEISQYRSQIKLFEEQCKYLQSQRDRNVENLENQVALLSTELERLNSLLGDKTLTIEQWVSKYSDVEIQLKVRNEIIEERNQELARVQKLWQDSLDKLRIFEDQLRNQVEMNDGLERQLQILSQEKLSKDQYVFIVEQKDIQIQQLKGSIQLLEMRLSELENLLLASRKENDNLSLKLETINQQFDFYTQENTELQNLRIALQNDLEKQFQDNSKLSEELFKQKVNNGELERQLEGLKHEQGQIISCQLQQLECDVQSYQNDFETTKQQLQDAELKCGELEEAKDQLASEYQNLYRKSNEEANKLKSKIEELELTNQTLQGLKQQLARQLDDRTQELFTFKQQYQQTQNDFNNYKGRSAEDIYQLKLQIEDTLLQLQKMTTRKNQVEDELNLRVKDIRGLQDQISQLNLEFSQYKNRYQLENSTFKSQIGDYEINLSQLQQSKTKLLKELDDKDAEIQSLKEQLSQLRQTSAQTIADLEKKIYNYEEKLSLLSSEIQRMIFQTNQKNDQLQEQTKQIDEYTVKIKNLEQLWRNDVLNYQEKQTELEQLLTNSQEYREKYSKADAEILKLRTSVEELNHLNQTLQRQADQYAIEQRYRQTVEEELQQKNQFLQNQLNNQTSVNSELKFFLEDQTQQIKRLEYELSQKTDSEGELKFKLDKLIEELKNKSLQLQDVEYQLTQFQSEIQSTEETVCQYEKETGQWKDKFSNLNKEYHRNLEELMLAKAELDAVKQRSSQVEYRKESISYDIKRSYVQKENLFESKSFISRPLKDANI
ncbi:hypothetical protein pb186bvf_006533 [Paramecium bursaria]